jgi:hypothetical protein
VAGNGTFQPKQWDIDRRSKTHGRPFFMIWREYIERGEVVYACTLFVSTDWIGF